MSYSLELGHTERLHLQNLYLCVCLQGANLDGEECYAYFGIFLDSLLPMLNAIDAGRAINPKDHQSIVLARGLGQPSQEVQEFMRRKFSFGHPDQDVILEISRPNA